MKTKQLSINIDLNPLKEEVVQLFQKFIQCINKSDVCNEDVGDTEIKVLASCSLAHMSLSSLHPCSKELFLSFFVNFFHYSCENIREFDLEEKLDIFSKLAGFLQQSIFTPEEKLQVDNAFNLHKTSVH